MAITINPISYGTGGGGLVPTIRVTAPASSLLTCGSQSYQLGESETSHDFVVTVSASPYTVTASKSGKTQSKSVTVDAVALFPVTLDYKLWLYNEGDECESVTGGWQGTAMPNGGAGALAPTLTRNATNLYAGSSASHSIGLCAPTNKVSLKAGDVISWDISTSTLSSYGWVDVSLTSSNSSCGVNPSYNECVAYGGEIPTEHPRQYTGIKTLNFSDLGIADGEYYVGVLFYYYGSGAWCTINRVWIE